jgi:hypothetical protein
MNNAAFEGATKENGERRQESGIAPATSTANDLLLDLSPAPLPAGLLALLVDETRDGHESPASEGALSCGVRVVEDAIARAQAAVVPPIGAEAQAVAEFIEAGRAWVETVTGPPCAPRELARVSSIVLTMLVRPSYAAVTRHFAASAISRGKKLPCALPALMFAVDAADRMLLAAALVG